jgi:4-hydroxybenzoyl-CoA reductase alpha subunit
MKDFDFIGKDIPRIDATDKATGNALFTVDLSFPHMLHAKLLRSPHPHAKILNIDTRKAEKLPGVKAVITGKDTPYTFGVSHFDQTPLQTEKVRHVGDAVAAVAAIDADTALEALRLIKVDYEPLPFVFDPLEAMKPGAPVIHQGKERNIAAHSQYNVGNVEEAFRKSDFVFEDHFETQRVSHVCPEPHNGIAVWDSSGKLTFYYCTQAPDLTRLQLAKALGVPESKVRVITHTVGGGFGSRATSKFSMDFAAIVLARKAGKPVKIEYTREEEFIYATFRHKFIMDIKTGVTKEGMILGRQVTTVCDNGAYCDYGPVCTNVGGAMAGTLYRYMNYKFDGYSVYTNLPYGGAMRGLGNPAVTYAMETQLSMIAARLKMDPLEIRVKNAVHTGDETASGAILRSCGLTESLQAVAEKIQWREKRAHPHPNRGLGIACGVHFTGVRLSPGIDADFAGANLIVNDDGSVNLATSCTEIGSGSNTVYAQIASEILGVVPEKIHVVFGDTENCPMGWGSRASRNTGVGGMAVKLASEDARRQILSAASKKMEIPPEGLDIKKGMVYAKGTPSYALSIADIVRFNRYRKNGQAIMAQAHWDAPSELADKVTGRGNFSYAFSFGAKAVEVEVDPGTGKVTILKVVAAQDVGTAINPLGIHCQLEGASHMGLGYALTEEILIDPKGRMANNHLADYKILTSLDMPPVESIILESGDPIGPFGAKGVGEMATIGIPEAIAAAIHDAVGVWVKDLPVTSEKVWMQLQKSKKENKTT